MESKTISLESSHRNPVEIKVYDTPATGLIWKHDISEYESVFADEEYYLRLTSFDVDHIESLQFFVNDEEQLVIYDKGKYLFANSGTRKTCVFRNRFGFVELSFTIRYEDGTVERWYSSHISILVHKNEELESINLMIDYVYNKRDQLLVNGDIGSRTTGDIKPSSFINLDTKISLASEILKIYKDNYGYFSANCRFKTKVVDVIDDANKLQRITPKTLQYIATQPGYLREGTLSSGIKINDRHYIPQKTLIEKNVYSFDIYENRVIVGFISKMIEDVSTMIKDVNSLLANRNRSREVAGDYVHSSVFIFQRNEKTLSDSLIKLFKLKKEFETTLRLYRRALDVKGDIITHIPKPSAIFLSVAQYNVFYNSIHKWFEFGIYNLDQERFMMSFVNGSTLYEVYILAKLIETLNSLGYSEQRQTRFSYKVWNNAYYKNTLCSNTFSFVRDDERIVLYYQPVIYSGNYRPVNGINIYRNNSISVEGLESYYYTPDYLIKYEKGGIERYTVLDAKFMDRSFVRSSQISKMVYKYLFSISARGSESIDGLDVLYGKADIHDTYESVYDLQIYGQEITPKFDIIPITAGVNNEKHMAYLSHIIMSAMNK